MVKYTPVSGIYVILNTKDGKVYVGKAQDINSRWQHHKTMLNRNTHDNIHLQRAWNKYGAKAFKFQKLEYCPIEKLNEREIHHIAIYKARGIAYNLTDGGDGIHGLIPSEETRQKMSAAAKGRIPHNKGKKASAEIRKRLSDAHKGIKMPPFTDEHKRKLSESNKNVSEERRRKSSLIHKGKVISKETRLKMSEAAKRRAMPAMLGKKHTEESRKKMSEAHRNISDETRQKMCASHKKRKHLSDLDT